MQSQIDLENQGTDAYNKCRLKTQNPLEVIFMQKLAIDWAHEDDKFEVYDGEKFLDTVEPAEDLVVFTENFPDDRIEEWTNKGAVIYGC